LILWSGFWIRLGILLENDREHKVGGLWSRLACEEAGTFNIFGA